MTDNPRATRIIDEFLSLEVTDKRFVLERLSNTKVFEPTEYWRRNGSINNLKIEEVPPQDFGHTRTIISKGTYPIDSFSDYACNLIWEAFGETMAHVAKRRYKTPTGEKRALSKMLSKELGKRNLQIRTTN